MSKFKLSVAPTFKAEVVIPLPGGEQAAAVFEFRHRTKDSMLEWLGGTKDRKDEELLSEILVGWDLDETFSPENIALLVQNHPSGARVLVQAYIDELTRARRKN